MSHILIVPHVFIAVCDAHKPTKDSSGRWRQRSSEPLKSVYQTTRCRIAKDSTNDMANTENVWENDDETSVSSEQWAAAVAGRRKQQWAIMRYGTWWPAYVIRRDFGRQSGLWSNEDTRSYPDVSESLVKGRALITFNLTSLPYPENKPVENTHSESN